MQTFLSWPGWAGVSGIAQIVALGTFVVAGWRYILQRRQFPAVYFTWDVIGQSTTPDGDQYHLLEFQNAGRSTALISTMFVSGARFQLVEGYRAPTTLAAGGSFQLLVSAAKLEDAWFRITWQSVSDRHKVHVEWAAILPRGAMGERQRQEVEHWYKRRRFSVRLLAHIRGSVVGPGCAPRATVRRATRWKARTMKIMTPADGTGPWFSAHPAGAGTLDLPYLPPA